MTQKNLIELQKNTWETHKEVWDFNYDDLLFKFNPIHRHPSTLDFTNYFKKKVDYFTNNKNLNIEKKLTKNYNLDTDSSLDFTLSSINIQFTNLLNNDSKENKPAINLLLPLALLPVFYYALDNFEDFKKIMCCLLRFNKTY